MNFSPGDRVFLDGRERAVVRSATGRERYIVDVVNGPKGIWVHKRRLYQEPHTRSRRQPRTIGRDADSMYRVGYLVRARRAYLPGNYSLEGAKKQVRSLKRRGMDAWVEHVDGRFVPVPGVKRQPGYLE